MGYYECPRCGGGQAYSSEEVGRTLALTLDTPSAADPTLFHTMKKTVSRCKNCGEKTIYTFTPEERKKFARDGIAGGWLGSGLFLLFGIIFIFIPLTILNWIGALLLVFSGFSLFLVMLSNSQLKNLNN
jgi:hypothetical protein